MMVSANSSGKKTKTFFFSFSEENFSIFDVFF